MVKASQQQTQDQIIEKNFSKLEPEFEILGTEVRIDVRPIKDVDDEEMKCGICQNILINPWMCWNSSNNEEEEFCAKMFCRACLPGNRIDESDISLQTRNSQYTVELEDMQCPSCSQNLTVKKALARDRKRLEKLEFNCKAT